MSTLLASPPIVLSAYPHWGPKTVPAFFFNDLQSQLYLICIIFSFLEKFFIIALLEERKNRVLQTLFLLSWRILNIPNHLFPSPLLIPSSGQCRPASITSALRERELEGVARTVVRTVAHWPPAPGGRTTWTVLSSDGPNMALTTN